MTINEIFVAHMRISVNPRVIWAARPPGEALASQNGMQNKLSEPPSLDSLQTTSVVDSFNLERAGRRGRFLGMAKLPFPAIGQALRRDTFGECLGLANPVGNTKRSAVATPRYVSSVRATCLYPLGSKEKTKSMAWMPSLLIL
ncbi:unnamed protein product [Penicillium roqueforti FM164]|uniref:Genomic scaffold, ProqFM164S01 n=1 Tax=Penicillium roqueforti (strain FM164) TaxID=1365484 RepID=W6PPW8_PENRF|nr:unnamed protein product [Penicillium roqueforti FM164]